MCIEGFRLPVAENTRDTDTMRGTNMAQSPRRQDVYRGTRSGINDPSPTPQHYSKDPSYSLYFQPRNTYFLVQCQGLFCGLVGRCWEAQLAMTALLLALLACCFRHMIP